MKSCEPSDRVTERFCSLNVEINKSPGHFDPQTVWF